MATQPGDDIDPALRNQLREDLLHRVWPMRGRDPRDTSRSASPLELLYDLTFVIAFAFAADELAHVILEGHPGEAIGAYAFAVFAVTWAWINSTWFASAYDNDDIVFRVATVVQMAGVIILTLGLPASFASAAEGHSPNNMLIVVGYVIMRVPLIALWLRAARDDPQRRRTSTAYAITIAIAQVGWLLSAIVPAPTIITVCALALLALAELTAPVVIERRLGRLPWNPGHIAERFALLTIITLGEVVAATTAATASLVHEEGWTAPAAVIAASGLVLAATFWWAYYLIPSRTILVRWPDRVFPWRYAHLPLFGAIAAVGGGLRIAALSVEGGHLSLTGIALAIVIPVAIVIVTVFLTWSVLLRAYDLTHVPLFLLSLTPLAGAVIVASVVGGDEPLHPEDTDQLVALVVIIALAALSFVVEVIGHEIVGFRHTLDAVRRHGSGS